MPVDHVQIDAPDRVDPSAIDENFLAFFMPATLETSNEAIVDEAR